LAVNLRHVALRMLPEARARLGQQILALAEEDCPGGARFSARRDAPFFQVGVTAKVAFYDSRHRAIPLELGDVERARDLAVTAANADVFAVIDDAGLRVLGHRADGADRNAGGFLTVHARILDVGPGAPVLEELDQGARVAGEVFGGVPEAVLVEWGLLESEPARAGVDALACGHAGLAADALGGVVEHAQLRIVRQVCHRRGRSRGGRHHQARAREPGSFEEVTPSLLAHGRGLPLSESGKHWGVSWPS